MRQKYFKDRANEVFYGPYPGMNLSNKPGSIEHFFRTNVVSPLINACIKGNYNTVKTLIDIGEDVNQNEGNCIAPLICASLNGHMNIVRLLISSGAKISYNLLCIIKEKAEENRKMDGEDFELTGNWKDLLDFLIQEGKKQ